MKKMDLEVEDRKTLLAMHFSCLGPCQSCFSHRFLPSQPTVKRPSLTGGKTLTTDLEDFMIFYCTYTPLFLDHTHITDKHTARGFRAKVINVGGCVCVCKS